MAVNKAVNKKIRRRQGIRKTLRLLAGLDGIPSNGKDWRGFAAEEKASKAANFWRRKKIIRGDRGTKRFGPEDMAMRDRVLTLLDGKEVGVQVKDYCDFMVVKKCRDRGVLPFIIWPDEGEEIAKERMLLLIISAYLSEFTPFQLRQLITKILAIKQPQAVKQNLFGRIFSRLQKAFF